MKFILSLIIFAFYLISPSTLPAATDVYINITKGVSKRLSYVISEFLAGGKGIEHLNDTVQEVLAYDLSIPDIFNQIDTQQFIKEVEDIDKKTGIINFDEWYQIGAHLLIKGTYTLSTDGLTIECRLYDVRKGKLIFGRRYSGSIESLRKILHRFSSEIIYRFTGVRGIGETKIAFLSRHSAHKEIYFMDYDGHNIVQKTHEKNLLMFPAWTSDGKEILFTGYSNNNPNLYSISWVEGKATKKLLSSRKGLNSSASCSPDGKYIALVLSNGGNSEIYLANRKGLTLRRLTYSDSIDTSPAWSPNGREIVFTSDRAGTPQIYIMDVEGANLRRLTYSGNYNDQPAWSPRGDSIAYVSRNNGHFDIFTIGIHGDRLTQLTFNSGNNENPSWSPDGMMISFSSNRTGLYQIYTMRADGTMQKRLTSLRGGGYSAVWSPQLDY